MQRFGSQECTSEQQRASKGSALLVAIRTDLKAMFAKYCTICAYLFIPQISDFGLARRANIFVPHEGGKFPVKWTAPEALKDSVSCWHIMAYGMCAICRDDPEKKWPPH